MTPLYADENFPRQVVEELRRAGHDVVTVQEAGQAGRQCSDKEVLATAVQGGRALLTLDRRHFIRIHLRNSTHGGIIVCTLDPDFTGQARRIHEVLDAEQPLAGKLIRINRPGDHATP